MPLEALYYHRYTEQSDVWAFGVCVWEITTSAEFPFTDIMEDADVIRFVSKGGRLRRDPRVTDALWSLLVRCWDAQPDQRPTFQTIVRKLDLMLDRDEEVYQQLDTIINMAATLRRPPPAYSAVRQDGQILYQATASKGGRYEVLGAARVQPSGPIYARVKKGAQGGELFVPFEQSSQTDTMPLYGTLPGMQQEESSTDAADAPPAHRGSTTLRRHERMPAPEDADVAAAEQWLARGLTRQEAEQLLQSAEIGSFLLRGSGNQTPAKSNVMGQVIERRKGGNEAGYRPACLTLELKNRIAKPPFRPRSPSPCAPTKTACCTTALLRTADGSYTCPDVAQRSQARTAPT
jgi:hypothetical protein